MRTRTQDLLAGLPNRKWLALVMLSVMMIGGVALTSGWA
jgi:hypothetical protein